MAMTIPLSNQEEPDERVPGLENRTPEPKGVIRRNLKLQVYLGVAVLFIVATAVSSLRHKPVKPQMQGTPPMLPESNANIEEMKRNLENLQRQQTTPRLNLSAPNSVPSVQPGVVPYASNEGMSTYNCISGQTCPPPQGPPYSSYQQPQQLSPQEQAQLQLAQREQELAYKSRFASNLAYSQSHSINGPSSLIAPSQAVPASSSFDSSSHTTAAPVPSQSYASTPYAGFTPQAQSTTSMQSATQLAPPAPTQSQRSPKDSQAPNTYKRAAEVNINSATGQPYVVYEGTWIETALMNRLDGDSSGPVKVLVANPVYSHDHQHVLIPEGTVILGESHKIGEAGFGQQRRLAISFHRMIMPDGYSVDLDQFQGLNQVGETGLKDKVNNHYFQIFGASIALGIVAGAAESSNNSGVLTANGAEAYKYGVASNLSKSATNVLDQFINIPPTITIREGHRVKVYISQDLLLPAYENHSISPSF